jgi:hypothetical protein
VSFYLRTGESIAEGAYAPLRTWSRRSLLALARQRPRQLARYLWNSFRRWSAIPGQVFTDPGRNCVAVLVEKPPGRPVRLRLVSNLAIAQYGEDYALWHGEDYYEPDFWRWTPA